MKPLSEQMIYALNCIDKGMETRGRVHGKTITAMSRNGLIKHIGDGEYVLTDTGTERLIEHKTKK